MDEDDVALRIAHLELDLRRTDPQLVWAFDRLGRRRALRSGLVCALVVTAFVCLTVGLALASFTIWVVGLGAFLASFAVDGHRVDGHRSTVGS